MCRAVDMPRQELRRLNLSPLADTETLYKQGVKAKAEM